MSSVRSMATSYFKHYSYIASVYRRHSFSKINISQGSVAMLLGYSGIVCDRSGANFFENVPLKEFWELVNIWQRYEQESWSFSALFYDSRCTLYNRSTLCLEKNVPLRHCPLSSPNINRFSKFFHWYILYTIYNNMVTKCHHTLNASLHYLLKYKFSKITMQKLFSETIVD